MLRRFFHELVEMALNVSLPGALGEVSLVAFPGTANATMAFNSGGTYAAGDGSPSGNWVSVPSGGVGAGFDIRWTPVSGTLTTGTASVWENLASNRTYGRNRSGVGAAQAVGTVEIRNASTLAVLTTCTVTLDAEVF